jgi:EpsD family peptidyl-prolyl cis-trans isomerase
VTVTELENEFRWASIPADKRDDQTTRRILSDLVKRKYLAQKAVDTGLDRNPTTLLDLMRSREQTLASALIQRDASAKAASIDNSEVARYMDNNPLKFAQRVFLFVDQITVALSANAQAAVESARQLKTIEDIDRKLTELAVVHNRSIGNLSSADFPENVFKQFQSHSQDQIFFISAGPTGVFFRVQDQEVRPLVGEEATTIARNLLLADFVQTDMRDKVNAGAAEVKYEGIYAKIMGQQDSRSANREDGK